MATGKKDFAKIQNDAELRKLNVQVNKINELTSKMGRSAYFKEFTLMEQISKKELVQSYEANPEQVKEYLNSIQSNLNYLWNNRRSDEVISSSTGIVKSGDEFFKILSPSVASAVKRGERTGRGKLSEKAIANIMEDDRTLLKRITDASDKDINDFINKWYEDKSVSGGKTLSTFLDNVYRREYAGQGASHSWGSPTVRMAIEDAILDGAEEPSMQDDSSDVESKMNDSLYDAWMKLFN